MDLEVETNMSPEGSKRTPVRDGNEGDLELRRALSDAQARIRDLEARVDGEARARSELVNLVSHELRTPITVISGFGRLLKDEVQGNLNAEQHRFVEESLKACRRLDQFVGDLLDARVGGDTLFTVELAEADLHGVLVSQLESLAPLLDERGIKVETSLLADVSTLLFDQRRVEQVITNLMTNAIRHGRPAGLIRIASRVRHDTGWGEIVEVSVEDDGLGIPEADHERLFAPYIRGIRAATGRDAEGLGIGLAICRRIIDAHGGRIWVENGESGGARFVFSLPRTECVGGED